MNVYKAALLGGCMMLGGCAGPIVLNYAPSSTMTVKGAEKIGSFEYAPARSGKIKPNQIRNTAAGNILLEKPIGEYFEKAVFTESRFVGIDVSGTQPIVHGTIDEFLIDDLGYSVDWTLIVTYIVDVPGTETPCFKAQKKLAKHSAKFANAFGTLNEVMKDNIELLFKDPGYLSCVAVGSVASVPASPSATGEHGRIVSPAATVAPVPPQKTPSAQDDDQGFVNFPSPAAR